MSQAEQKELPSNDCELHAIHIFVYFNTRFNNLTENKPEQAC